MPITSPTAAGSTRPRQWTNPGMGMPALVPFPIGEVPVGTPSTIQSTSPRQSGTTSPA